MDAETQKSCANIARKTIRIPSKQGIIGNGMEFSYEELMQELEKQREAIAKRIESGR